MVEVDNTAYVEFTIYLMHDLNKYIYLGQIAIKC